MDGPAQMIVPGRETLSWYPQWLLHNTDPENEIYFDVTPNIAAVPGTTSLVLAPGAMITLTGEQTYWARTADGTIADLHLVPTSLFAVPGQTPG